MILIEKLRAAFQAYGEREMSIAGNRAWSAVSISMIYFMLVTDFYFAAPMTAEKKTNHLTQLCVLEYAGPKLPPQFFYTV